MGSTPSASLWLCCGAVKTVRAAFGREQQIGQLEALACLLGPWNHPEDFKRQKHVIHFIDNSLRCLAVSRVGARCLTATSSFSSTLLLSLFRVVDTAWSTFNPVQTSQISQAAAVGTVLLPPVLVGRRKNTLCIHEAIFGQQALDSLVASISAPASFSWLAHLDVPRLRPHELAAVAVFVALGGGVGYGHNGAASLSLPCLILQAGSQPSLGASAQARHDSKATSFAIDCICKCLMTSRCQQKDEKSEKHMRSCVSFFWVPVPCLLCLWVPFELPLHY